MKDFDKPDRYDFSLDVTTMMKVIPVFNVIQLAMAITLRSRITQNF
jgi:hypothetical protein